MNRCGGGALICSIVPPIIACRPLRAGGVLAARELPPPTSGEHTLRACGGTRPRVPQVQPTLGGASVLASRNDSIIRIMGQNDEPRGGCETSLSPVAAVRRQKPAKVRKPSASLPRRLRLMKPLPCCCPHYSLKSCRGTAALWSALLWHRFWQTTGHRQTTRALRLPRAAERGSAWPASRPSGQSGDKSPHSKNGAGRVNPKPGRIDLRAPRPPCSSYLFWGNALSVCIRG